MTATPAPSLEVSDLPSVTFGASNLLWWGTLGFMFIEGTSLFICVAVYFYLWRNYHAWPPLHTPRPDLFWPAVQGGLLLLSIWPAVLLRRAAQARALDRLTVWMIVLLVFVIGSTAVRAGEFLSLNCRWDTNAYGSAAWLTLGFHSTLLVVNLFEVAMILFLLRSSRFEEKYFSDADDSGFYWLFLVGSWIPLGIMVFLSPYLLRGSPA